METYFSNILILTNPEPPLCTSRHFFLRSSRRIKLFKKPCATNTTVLSCSASFDNRSAQRRTRFFASLKDSIPLLLRPMSHRARELRSQNRMGRRTKGSEKIFRSNSRKSWSIMSSISLPKMALAVSWERTSVLQKTFLISL